MKTVGTMHGFSGSALNFLLWQKKVARPELDILLYRGHKKLIIRILKGKTQLFLQSPCVFAVQKDFFYINTAAFSFKKPGDKPE